MEKKGVDTIQQSSITTSKDRGGVYSKVRQTLWAVRPTSSGECGSNGVYRALY